MSKEELIDTLAIDVEGKNNKHDITIFTLSTCMWCKKCKRWLNEHDIKYHYIDVDKIENGQKSQIIDYLKSNFDKRISYPFMVCDGEPIVGYSPNTYEEVIEKGGGE
ncbi:MAG: glutaredoxin family protein [Promethearchaeia archaeon]